MALGSLGNVLFRAQRFEEAITAHAAALEIFREADDREHQA
jgi:hypothetical protein